MVVRLSGQRLVRVKPKLQFTCLISKYCFMSYAFNDAIKEYCEKQSKVDKEFAEDYKKKNKSIQGCVDYILGEMAKDSYVQKHKNKGICGMGVTDDVVYGLVHHYFHEDDLDVKVLDPKEVKVSVSVTPQKQAAKPAPVEEVEDEEEDEKGNDDEDECAGELVKRYTGNTEQRFEALIKDGKTPTQKPSKTAWNMYSLIDKGNTNYSGLLYKKGWKCGTNRHVLVAEKADYPKAYEGRVITKKGEDVAKANDAVSILDSIKKRTNKVARIDVLSIRSSLAGIKKDTTDLDYTFVILGLPQAYVLLRYQEAVKFFNALEHYKMDTIYYATQSDPIAAYKDDVFMAIMPRLQDWDNDYLGTMEGFYPIDLRDAEMVEQPNDVEDTEEEVIDEVEPETDVEEESEEVEDENEDSSEDDDDMYIPLF